MKKRVYRVWGTKLGAFCWNKGASAETLEVRWYLHEKRQFPEEVLYRITVEPIKKARKKLSSR